MKNISFLSLNFQFLEVTFSIYLNRHVFVMYRSNSDAENNVQHSNQVLRYPLTERSSLLPYACVWENF